MTVELRQLNGDKKVLRHFLDVVDAVYAGDPNYVRSLDMDVSDRMNPKKNPFFEAGEATGWVAYDRGVPVGRISASIDRLHQERHGDGAGFFGFFDCIDDPVVAKVLLDTAAGWLEGRGCLTMRGPFSLSINEECGCLVEGFDTPPMIMMPHHRAYQGGLIENAGLVKCKDLFAWTYDVGSVPPRAQKAHVLPELTKLTYVNGEVAAVALALPNINEFIADARGKLFPFGAIKLLWRLRVRGPKTARLIILGIGKKWRNVRKYAGLSAFLYVEMNQAGHLLGMKRGELGWTLEDNAPINVGIKMMGGRVYKKYRLYERALGLASASR